MRLIVVFDTNILISGTGWKGSPSRCLELARTGMVQHITCQEMLAEFSEKLQTKLKFPRDQVTKTIVDLLDFTEIVKISHTLKVIDVDPDDDVVVECAVVGGADFIVTGDGHLLTIGNYQGIAIIKAKDFLDRVRKPES